MRYSIATVLATLLAGQAAAASIKHGHQHFHTKKEAQPSAMEVGVSVKRDLLSSAALGVLGSLTVLQGANAGPGVGAQAWIGSDGPYTNTFTNNAGQELILVIWGPQGSWVNVNVPLITLTLDPLATQTISFASGLSGAWTAIYSDTLTSMGQISNTWGEFTFSPTGVVDVSREVNMSGHGMSIVGPTCTTNMDTCVFVCAAGNTCTDGYLLQNCDNGSQEGATYGVYGGMPSGGCGWNGAATASLQTQFY